MLKSSIKWKECGFPQRELETESTEYEISFPPCDPTLSYRFLFWRGMDCDPLRECSPCGVFIPDGPIVPACGWGKVWNCMALVGSISSRNPKRWKVAYGQISSSIPLRRFDLFSKYIFLNRKHRTRRCRVWNIQSHKNTIICNVFTVFNLKIKLEESDISTFCSFFFYSLQLKIFHSSVCNCLKLFFHMKKFVSLWTLYSSLHNYSTHKYLWGDRQKYTFTRVSQIVNNDAALV